MIDCDLSVPTLPCTTEYSGNIKDVCHYLLRERPKGWLEEFRKQQEMSSSQTPARPKIGSPIRFRHISPGVVLPQQVQRKSPDIYRTNWLALCTFIYVLKGRQPNSEGRGV